MSQLAQAFEPHNGLAEALHYHDTRRRGFVSVLVLDDGRQGPGHKQHSFRLSQLSETLPAYQRMPAVYIAQNEFSKPNRQAVNLERLTSCYLDLDTYNVPRLAAASPEFLRDEVLLTCEQTMLPPPSIIVFSGRGVQLKWIFPKPIPAVALPRWQAVQHNLYACFAHLGADLRALDCSRVLRLVGTTHQRTGEVVRIIHRTVVPTMGGEPTSRGVVGYTLDVLAEALLPHSRQQIEAARAEITEVIRDERKKVRRAAKARRAAAQDQGQAQPKKRKANAGSKPLDLFDLAWRRIADLRKLIKLRGWKKGAPATQRNAFVLTAAICLSYCVPADDLLGNLLELAQEFAPTWTEAEVKTCAHSVIARARAVPSISRSPYATAYEDPRYTPSSAKLAEWLAVTDEEARGMTSIFGQAERKRRDRERKSAGRRASGSLTKSQYQGRASNRAEMACQMREEGLDAATVAERLGVKKRAVFGYWARAAKSAAGCAKSVSHNVCLAAA